MESVTSARAVIVTGGNAGLGYECAKTIAAASQDWHVVIASRNAATSAAAVQRMISETGNTHIEAMPLDLASLASVHAFSQAWAARDDLPPLHSVVCNAGVQVARGITYTTDGFETMFGVNHLGHFLLVNLLLPHMLAPARIVVVSSGTHDPATLDGRFTPPDYRGARALAWPEQGGTSSLSGIRRYATSKLCNIFFTYELARRLQAHGSDTESLITANAYDPGATPGTGLVRDYSPILRRLWTSPIIRRLLQAFGARIYDVHTSGRAMARLVLDPQLATISGNYFHVMEETPSSQESYDRAKAAELWETSADLVKLAPNETLLKRQFQEA